MPKLPASIFSHSQLLSHLVGTASKRYWDELGINPFFNHFMLKPSKHLSGPSRFGSPPVHDPSKAYLDELGISTLFYPLLLHRLK